MFQIQPKVEPRDWNGKEGLKFKLKLPGENVRVEQWVFRLCPSKALCFSYEREERSNFLEIQQNERVRAGKGFWGTLWDGLKLNIIG